MEKALEIYNSVKNVLGEEELFLVGGAVRDMQMGNEPKDYDFCGPLHPDTVIELVKKAGRRPYVTGASFGTVGWKTQLEDGSFVYVEYTVYRTEKYVSGSRKPKTIFYGASGEEI